jgi:putative nucleotidyltransferase with HDIG domain
MPTGPGRAAAPSRAHAEPTVTDIPWWERTDFLVDVGDRTVEAANLEERTILTSVGNRLESGKYALPVLPLTLIKVIELANIPEPEVKAIAECIRTDAVVAGEVLSLVNSAAFAAASPIKDLQRAVVHVGPRRVRDLMIAVAARLTVFRSCDAERAQRLWLHAIAAAVLGREVARATACNPEEAFLAGLLHDIGKTVVLGVVTEEERSNVKVRVSDGLLDRLCDSVHTGTGARVARDWKLPAPISAAIEGHHSRLHRNSAPIVALTALANDLCGFIGIGCPRRPVELGGHPAFPILGLDSHQAALFLARVPSILGEAPEFHGVVKFTK